MRALRLAKVCRSHFKSMHFRRPQSKKSHRLFPGDSPLLRRAFLNDRGSVLVLPPRFENHPELFAAYRLWLCGQGIDPDTGRMTIDGLAFFDNLLREQNARNRARRRGRQDLAA